MKNQHLAICLCALAVALVLGQPAQAANGNLVANCANANIDLTALTTLPFTSANVNPSPNGSVTPACLAASANQDGVKCFTPQNSCSLTITGEGGASDANTRVAIASGACSNTPASCTGSGATNTISGFAVTAGTQYCIYVETTSSQLIGFTLTGSGCGTLPVELQSFSVGSEDEAGETDPDSQ
jgi:hypothetical protein